MPLKLIYQMFAKLLSWMVLHVRSDTAKEIEILVLRQQLAVLQRRTPQLRISWSDRAVIAVYRAKTRSQARDLEIDPSTGQGMITRWPRDCSP